MQGHVFFTTLIGNQTQNKFYRDPAGKELIATYDPGDIRGYMVEGLHYASVPFSGKVLDVDLDEGLEVQMFGVKITQDPEDFYALGFLMKFRKKMSDYLADYPELYRQVSFSFTVINRPSGTAQRIRMTLRHFQYQPGRVRRPHNGLSPGWG